MTADEEIRALQAAGRLSQRCPCGVTEAAGSYCSSCLRLMGPSDWGVDDRKKHPGPALDPSSGPEAPLDGSVDPDAALEGATAVETVNRADPVRAEAVA